MTIRLGVVMDPIGSINTVKDSTYGMLREAQRRGWEIQYMEMNDLYLADGIAGARMRRLELLFEGDEWYRFLDSSVAELSQLDVILMRKDPPFDMEYIYCSYILERAENEGVLIVNKPQALRDANEKVFTAWFPQCTPPTLISRQYADLRSFLKEHRDIILKPLEGMGGASVFRVSTTDPNLSVIMENLTHHQTRYVMAQRFIAEIRDGDKRIIVINGDPVPYSLARIPAPGETRGNLAAGAKGVGKPLSERDLWICNQVGPVLKDKGIVFSGLDIIGDYLTEINVTSPTGIRELDRIFDLNISGLLLNAIEDIIHRKQT
jgi:glutathione synthase